MGAAQLAPFSFQYNTLWFGDAQKRGVSLTWLLTCRTTLSALIVDGPAPSGGHHDSVWSRPALSITMLSVAVVEALLGVALLLVMAVSCGCLVASSSKRASYEQVK